MGKWIASAIIFFILAVAIPVGYSTLYTRAQIQHECAALELLTAQPPVPPIPGKPTSFEVYRFYAALSAWEHADGCR